jgi:hypothetical protein
MIIPYTQMMGFIVNGYKPVYTHYFNRELTFTFENYVKSQLHLQVVTELYGRDIFQYNNALKYLRGEDKFVLDCSEVLRFFYQDMTNMLCNVLKKNPDLNTKVMIVSDLGRPSQIPSKKVSLSDVVEELQESMHGSGDSKSTIYSDGIFVKFGYDELDSLKANELLALSSVFLYYGSNSAETYVVEVI